MRGYFLCLVCCFFLFSFRIASYADMVQTPSDATPSDAWRVVDDESAGPGGLSPASVISFDDAAVLLSISGDSLTNCVRYDVTISGVQYVCLFPSEYSSALMVDDDGYLWNVSTSDISGRLFSESFDPTADEGMLLYLSPCLGNNFSENHNYGSPNSIRTYYWTSGSYDRLTYDERYVTVLVDDVHFLFSSDDTLKYVVVFLVGCCLICLWKRSSR